MRPMIALVPKQINSDRTAPGITTSAVSGVEVNLSCDYKPVSWEQVLHRRRCDHVCADAFTGCSAHTPRHTKTARRGKNGSFCDHMLLRPV